jgi:hypothetical protein
MRHRSNKSPPSDPQLLVAAARAVVATFQEAMEKKQIPGSASAALRLLEAALEPYHQGPRDRP